MSEASWLGFGLTGTMTRTCLYFMPLSQGVGAPYPVNFSLTVGGGSLPSRTINIEGARLGQPDGFRIEEAMPALSQQGSGLYFVKIDFSSSAHRLNMAISSVSLDIQYQQSSVAFRPLLISSFCGKTEQLGQLKEDSDTSSLYPSRTGFAIRDPNLYPLILLINSSNKSLAVKILSLATREFVHSMILEPESVREYEPADLGLRHYSKLDCNSGSIEVELFQVFFENTEIAGDNISLSETVQKKGAATASYIVYRNRNSRRIASVLSL